MLTDFVGKKFNGPDQPVYLTVDQYGTAVLSIEWSDPAPARLKKSSSLHFKLYNQRTHSWPDCLKFEFTGIVKNSNEYYYKPQSQEAFDELRSVLYVYDHITRLERDVLHTLFLVVVDTAAK